MSPIRAVVEGLVVVAVLGVLIYTGYQAREAAGIVDKFRRIPTEFHVVGGAPGNSPVKIIGGSMTFRAAGTSLSGQAVTGGILVEVAKHWREVKVEAEGKRVRVQPGVIGGHVNRLLAPHGSKIGPDPASINACMMGGILAFKRITLSSQASIFKLLPKGRAAT